MLVSEILTQRTGSPEPSFLRGSKIASTGTLTLIPGLTEAAGAFTLLVLNILFMSF